jgi:hypothetical protein
MSKKDKLLAAFMEIPPKKNLTWNDLIALMSALNFEQLEGDGSRVKFYHKAKDVMINLHKPHPDNILKTYLIKQIQDKLKEVCNG